MAAWRGVAGAWWMRLGSPAPPAPADDPPLAMVSVRRSGAAAVAVAKSGASMVAVRKSGAAGVEVRKDG